MRHNVYGNHLGRDTNGAKQLYRSLIRAVLIQGKITTTKAKALAVRPDLERVISLSRTDTEHNRRLIAKMLGDGIMLEMIYKQVGPGFKDVQSGFTRILKMGPRLSDAAEMVMLEMTRMPIEKPLVVKDETKETEVETKSKRKVKKLTKKINVKTN